MKLVGNDLDKFVEIVQELENVPEIVDIKTKRSCTKKAVEGKKGVDDYSSMQVAVKQEPGFVEPMSQSLVCISKEVVVKQEPNSDNSLVVRKRGRPAKTNNNQLVCFETQQSIVEPTVRKRGRPAKKKNVQQKNVQKKSVIRKKKVEKKKKVGKKNKK